MKSEKKRVLLIGYGGFMGCYLSSGENLRLCPGDNYEFDIWGSRELRSVAGSRDWAMRTCAAAACRDRQPPTLAGDYALATGLDRLQLGTFAGPAIESPRSCRPDCYFHDLLRS